MSGFYVRQSIQSGVCNDGHVTEGLRDFMYDYEEYCVLRCDAVQRGIGLQTFREKALACSVHSLCMQYIPWGRQ
jgi:hypothetical protein